MSTPSAYRPRVMISSAMKGFGAEREAIAHIIEDAHLVPWYAENPPEEFRGVTGETLSFEMAARCDLYLLIIFSRYGSQVFAGDTRSVTHQEYLKAREANRYKVRVFIAAEALEHADSPELRTFIDEVNAFQTGYVSTVFHNLADLETALRMALASWQQGGQGARDAYVQTVHNEYKLFRNPVTGREMDYSATVLLTLRAQVQTPLRREEWGDDDEPGRRERGGRRARREQRERKPIVEIVKAPPQVATDLLAHHQHLVVLGDVGAGKSTLLKRLAHDAAETYPHAQQTRIPILVTATRLGAMAARYPTDSLAEVVGLLQEEDTRFEALRPTIHATVSNALARGGALLLVDGLDEATPAEQGNVFRLLGGIGANLALLASRPAAYSGQLAGWQVADLQQLGGEQRRDLIVRVFRAELDNSTTAPDDAALARAAAELEEALSAREADLAAWAGNPLLLTLIAVQFTRDRRLPESRARIYAFAIEDLQRQRPPTARRYLTQEELETFLRLLALRMTEALRRRATVAEVRNTYLQTELAAHYPDMSLRTAVAREVLERSGVLQGDATARASDADGASAHDQDPYEYVHLSFREYLAACALAEMPSDERGELAARHCLHQQWEQVLLLLVSRLDTTGQSPQADRLIRTLLAADHQQIVALGSRDPTHIALRMASRCALARGKLTGDRLFAEIQRAWWRVWRAEERRNNSAIVLLDFFDQLDNVDSDEMPTFLSEGVALELGRLMSRRGFPTSHWWVYALRAMPLALLLLYVVGQITLDIAPLAHSGWGDWVRHALPICVLMILSLIVALRLYGRRALISQIRIQMVRGALEGDNAPRIQAFAQLEARAPTKCLLAALRQGDADVRTTAASALGQLGERAPVEPLLNALHDTDSKVRRAAAQALGRLGAHAPVEALLAALQDADRRERGAWVRAMDLPFGAFWAAATAIEQVAAHTPIEPLIAALHDESSSIREVAAQTLGRLGDRAPVDALVTALRDDSLGVRQAAAIALGRLGDQAVATALSQLGDQALVEPLLAALGDSRDSVRREAAQVLGRLGAHAPIEALLALLHGKRSVWDSPVGEAAAREAAAREAAASALGQLGERAPIEPLVTALHDQRTEVHLAALNALGQLGAHAPVEAVEALVALLRENYAYMRRAAVTALGQLGDRAPVEPLVDALADEDWDIRKEAANALGQLGARAPIEPLVKALHDWKHDVRLAAAQALSQLGDRIPIEPLVAALGDANEDVRQALFTALRQRELPTEVTRVFAQRADRFPRMRAQGLFRAIQRLTDWPVLLVAILAQVVLVAPALTKSFPLPAALRWLFDLTAWWQVLLIVALYIFIHAVVSLGPAMMLEVEEVQKERATALETAESAIRRQVADTRSATLATEGE